MLTPDVVSVTCQDEPEVSSEMDEGKLARTWDAPDIQLMAERDGPV